MSDVTLDVKCDIANEAEVKALAVSLLSTRPQGCSNSLTYLSRSGCGRSQVWPCSARPGQQCSIVHFPQVHLPNVCMFRCNPETLVVILCSVEDASADDWDRSCAVNIKAPNWLLARIQQTHVIWLAHAEHIVDLPIASLSRQLMQTRSSERHSRLWLY